MVIYFSGTGNSRYTAEQIGTLTGDAVYDAAGDIRDRTGTALSDTRPYVFVAPVYVSAPPLEWMEFLKKSRFEGNRKAYFVMTCAGGMGASPAYCRRLAEEAGLCYMGTASVILPQNYIAFFTTKTPEENRAILAAARPVIQDLSGKISRSEPFPDPGMKKWEVRSTEMVLKPYYRWFIRAKKFRVEESCVGCGKCETVCPLGNISMVDNRPRWGDRCTHCMACINRCPKDAIEYGKTTAGKIRYRGPEQVLKQET